MNQQTNVQTISPVALPGIEQGERRKPGNRSPLMFSCMFGAWLLTLVWFGPRLLSVLDGAQGWLELSLLGFLVTFVPLAWLYGLYNICVISFAIYDRHLLNKEGHTEHLAPRDTPVAILYTTCNDFVESSALSCIQLDYPNYLLYILDDSSNAAYKRRVDKFAAQYGERVKVIRRAVRTGFKAGNLNHALENYITEPLFAVIDADEILPRDFLGKLVPKLMSDPNCGFVQANHRCMRNGTQLKQDMSVGIDVHWTWYQPLRNRYGFVMFLGHGALLRRSCWKQVGGFPEIVSEDLAFAVALKERGYHGTFVEDVICMEEFPDSVRAFRVRHVKWTRGTCEFLHNYFFKILFSKGLSWPEKLDILFPTINLPLTFIFFLFMINTGILMPLLMGQEQILTWELLGAQYTMQVMSPPAELLPLYSTDFYLITLATILSPILCFIIALYRQPLRLVRFLAHSTALYATLSPLSTMCVLGYLFTGKARFLVTGDKTQAGGTESTKGLLAKINQFFTETHPDSKAVRAFEVIMGVVLLAGALVSLQITLAGLAVGYILLVIMHRTDWNDGWLKVFAWIPFLGIATGIAIGGFGMFGVQPVMFGFGFHF